LQEGYIHIRKNKIYYKKWGQGPRLLIALHGFAHDHQMFNILQKGLGPHFTVYAIDLPFHGRTKWKEKSYQPSHIGTMVRYVLQQEGKDQFTALGFSYGARIWMASLPLLHSQLSHLYLLAPDGLRTQWLGIAERTPGPLIWLLDQFSKKPDRLPRLADRLRKWRLINRFAHRFVHHHLGTIKNKSRLFNTWRSMQHFRVNKRDVKKLLAENSIPLTVIVGKRDSIIALSAVKSLVKDLPGAQLHLLNKSHFLIDGSIVRLIK
jgi:pimeloyl-ACP methyl ester carboxylesterase